MFISEAMAQAAGGAAGAGGGSLIGGLMPLIIIFIIFYFLLIRPQNKRMKQHREMIAAVKRGDTIVTSGGIVGKVVRVHDEENEVSAEIAEGVKVRIVRNTIADVRVKGEPQKEND